MSIEIGAVPGFVGLLITDDGDQVEIVMTTDQARDFSNAIGEGILAASRTGAMT